MKVALIGSSGQVGRNLCLTVPEPYELIIYHFDITNYSDMQTFMSKHNPDMVINAAAYTNVDLAEIEKTKASEINTKAVMNLSKLSKKLVHLSTDFVFDGTATSPILPESKPNAINYYGMTKQISESYVLENKNNLLIRTAWVYSKYRTNFVKTMLKLMNELDELKVVSDQIGTPTNAQSLAKAIWKLIQHNKNGIWHYTDDGVTTWYDFALVIQEEAYKRDLIRKKIPIIPITSKLYNSPINRPLYSVLDKSKTWDIIGIPNHWKVELINCLEIMRD
jgi:dTDP-4-dehydrorhamnose reductase